MSSGIYVIRNKENNKIYIGSASNINKRFSTHRNNLKNNRHPNIHLQNAWNKYGERSFEFEVVEHVDKKILVEKEQEYIDELQPQYNKRLLANSNLGIKQPASQIEKRAARLIGHPFWGLRKQTEETRKKVSASLLGNQRTKGHKLTDEHKRKVAEAGIGRKHTEEAKAKMSVIAKAKGISSEHMKILIAARKKVGYHFSEEAKARVSAGLMGRVVSEETRRKISESLKGRKKNGG